MIACILPDSSLVEQTRSTFLDGHDDICIEVGLMGEGVKQAARLAEEGFEVFISRGRTAQLINNSNPEWSVVEIPFTVLDVFQTIKRSKLYGKNIGVIAFASMIAGLDYFSMVMDTSIRFYPLNDESEIVPVVLQAIADDIDMIVGGAVTCSIANHYRIPFAVIENSPESMRQAAQEAKNITRAKQKEQTKGNLFRVVLDYAYDGIISVDATGRITIFNPMAERITKKPLQKL